MFGGVGRVHRAVTRCVEGIRRVYRGMQSDCWVHGGYTEGQRAVPRCM